LAVSEARETEAPNTFTRRAMMRQPPFDKNYRPSVCAVRLNANEICPVTLELLKHRGEITVEGQSS
jgi:hypothetical protein